MAPRAVANERPIVRMRVPSLRRAIPPTIEKILSVVEPAGFTPSQRDDLALALAEALANAVVHGNRLRPGAWVGITVKVEPRKCAVIAVRDSGFGFERESLPDPRDPEKLLLPDGRGVFLMRRLMDDVEYNRKGNEVRLTLRRRSRRRAA